MTDAPRCDVLIFVTTTSEREALEAAAKARKLTFTRKDSPLGRYYDMGTIGTWRVIAARTQMGSLAFGGSASQALFYQALTGATGLILVGMAFGVSPATQSLGDVLLSTSIIPYDMRDVVGNATGFVVRYDRASHHPAKTSLVEHFSRAAATLITSFKVHKGALLSGGARIQSIVFRDELVRSVPAGTAPVVGGEMEAVGVLSACPLESPTWLVVKGISDFADDRQRAEVVEGRKVACSNAASFVLDALATYRH